MHKLTKNEADILIQKLSKLDISHVSFSYQDGPKEIVWRYGSEALSVKKKGIDWSISTWIRTEDFVIDGSSRGQLARLANELQL